MHLEFCYFNNFHKTVFKKSLLRVTLAGCFCPPLVFRMEFWCQLEKVKHSDSNIC